MQAHSVSSPGSSDPLPLRPWEELAISAVGNVIDFWRFKHNHGRIWALLYLRDQALSALDLQQCLGLSKAAASILTRELEQWGVIHRERCPRTGTYLFRAETNLMAMIGRVLGEREAKLVQRVTSDLERGLLLARQEKGLDPSVLQRLERMLVLSQWVHRALTLFLSTARLDISDVAEILSHASPFANPPAPADSDGQLEKPKGRLANSIEKLQRLARKKGARHNE